MHESKVYAKFKLLRSKTRKQNLNWNSRNQKYEKPFRQEPVVHTPPHKDYLPDITQTENESDYREEDEAPGGPEDYEDDYHENGMQDRKKRGTKWKFFANKRDFEWNSQRRKIEFITRTFFLFIVPI